jgi:hypothetical protein
MFSVALRGVQRFGPLAASYRVLEIFHGDE